MEIEPFKIVALIVLALGVWIFFAPPPKFLQYMEDYREWTLEQYGARTVAVFIVLLLLTGTALIYGLDSNDLTTGIQVVAALLTLVVAVNAIRFHLHRRARR